MLTEKRRKEIAKRMFRELGEILRSRGIDTDNVTSFDQKDVERAMSAAGIPRIEREEFLAEMDASEGRVN